jgi:hypothetical protein
MTPHGGRGPSAAWASAPSGRDMKRAMAILRATAPSTPSPSPSRTARSILPLPRSAAPTEILPSALPGQRKPPHVRRNTREVRCACQMMATQVAKGEGNYLSQDERSKRVGLPFTS